MQGTFADLIPESPFKGGELLRNVPLFPRTYVLDGTAQTANINSMFGERRYKACAGAPWRAGPAHAKAPG
jgi:hypothetical protein